jgi:hypothetical protein
MNELFEAKPRWPGAPPICIAANLPAFASRQAWDDFHAANSPGNRVVRVWRCDTCQHWHAHTIACDPSGSSSGTGRSSKT